MEETSISSALEGFKCDISIILIINLKLRECKYFTWDNTASKWQNQDLRLDFCDFKNLGIFFLGCFYFINSVNFIYIYIFFK